MKLKGYEAIGEYTIGQNLDHVICGIPKVERDRADCATSTPTGFSRGRSFFWIETHTTRGDSLSPHFSQHKETRPPFFA